MYSITSVICIFSGVSVSNSTFNSLVQRYGDHEGKIDFDDYIHCIALLCHMFGTQLVIIIKTISSLSGTFGRSVSYAV